MSSKKPNTPKKPKPAKPDTTPAVEETKTTEIDVKNLGGRPTGLNQAMLDEILKNVRAGIPIQTAVGMVGISKATYFNWMRRGNDEQYRISKGEKPDPKEARFLEFLDSVTRAREEAKGAHIAVIVNAGARGDWRASAWWLSRQFKEEFGDDPAAHNIQNIHNTVNVSSSRAEIEALIKRVYEKHVKAIDAPTD